MIILFIAMSVMYLIFMLAMIVVWYLIPRQYILKKPQNCPHVSVIIPIRNEGEHIEKLINQIVAQSYPKESFEIIVVNDHSTDESVSIIERLKMDNIANLRLINLKKSKEGKKAALSEGIGYSKGEIIVTTDGDCRVSAEWLSAVINSFDKETQMVFGPVAMNGNTFFGKLQMIDFAALIGLGAATWKMGMSGMCNGANLAFRKDVFQKCKGYEGSEQYPSGDDEFLLRKVYEHYPDGIRFVKSEEAVVFTDVQPNIKSFVQQRIRWAGKWQLHRDLGTKLLALFVFFFYAFMLLTIVWTFFTNENFNAILGIWGVKWILDVVLVASVLNLNSQKLPLIESVILSLLYPFYAIGIGISTINYTFEWKGRQY